ncbi:polyphosphate glucokinase [Myxococcaceae bacterium]|jgi:polyphosphate glucokinase|nr:polyphosphate glucokinase [Myxococcaceae bacterium]
MAVLGIDIGGTGIKGAPVDTARGVLLAERHRIPTPRPATPAAVARVVGEVARHFRWRGPIGCTFPGVVKNGVVQTAANLDPSWVGVHGERLFSRSTKCPVLLLNDADAAGVAEMTFGRGRGHRGVVLMLTLGTGIGSALFANGMLVPNTELGHLEIGGKEAEARASERAKKKHDLGWKAWAKQVNRVLATLEALFSPDRILLGGGVSAKYDHYMDYLESRCEIVPAKLENDAGIVGAALIDRDLLERGVGARSASPKRTPRKATRPASDRDASRGGSTRTKRRARKKPGSRSR